MRRKLALGVGLAGVLSGSAVGQFAVDRAPGGTPPAETARPFGGVEPAPGPFGGGQRGGVPSVPAAPPRPMAPGRYVPPVGGVMPAGGPMPAAPANGFRPATEPTAAAGPVDPADIPTSLGPGHPLAVKPEDGAYFLCVKSYSRPHRPDPSDPGMTARELAEGLAKEIREIHPELKDHVFLYELISDEKKAEARARAEARKRAEAFARQLEVYRKKAELQGMEFLGADTRIKYQTFNFRDQVAVLVGGYRTEDEAVKALAVVKKWPAPRDTRLMDGAAIASRGPDGKSVIEKTHLNPFAQAMVVQNPAAPKHLIAKSVGLDPFVVRLNEGRPYNLLKATKGWTIGVKAFTAPVQIVSKDSEPSVMHRMGLSKGADVLRAGAEQAEVLAKALREMKGPDKQPLHLEAFVLHTRNASIVTVGQFDSPNDPALLETRRVLESLTFNLSRDNRGTQLTGTGQKLFGDPDQPLLPVQIPKP